jgi:hypothetical protein
MKVGILVGLSVIATICHAQVTYKTSGARVDSVVAELARQASQQLVTHKEIAGEIVVVVVKDVSAEEFRKRLAECVSGKWVKKDDGTLELRVDAALSAERRRAAQKEMASDARRRIGKTRELYKDQLNEPEVRTWAANLQICLDIVETLPNSVLEDVLPMSRVVLSTVPNKAQRQLGDVTAIVRNYYPNMEIESVKISVERGWHMPFLTASVWIYDRSGMFQQGTAGLFDLDKPREKQPGKEIEWSAASLELARNYRSSDARAESGMVSLSQELREVLSKPTKIDPISFGFGEGLHAVADEKGVQLMATTADDDIRGGLAYGVGRTTTGDFWQSIGRVDTLVADEKDGWIIVRPSDPIVAREQRGDRAALEKLIAKAKGKAWVSLDDLVEFACSNLNCSNIPGAYVLPFQVMVNYYGVTGESYVSGDLRSLQFYGTLGTSQRQRFKNGEELQVAQMPPNAKTVLWALFSEPGRVIPSHLQVEPTSVMPDGLPQSLRVSGSVKDSTLLCPLPDAGDPTVPSRGRSMTDVAQTRWMRRYTDDQYSNRPPELTRVLLGNRTLWEFNLINGNQTYARMKVADDRVPSVATPFLMEDLPDNVKKEIDRAYEEFVKAMGGGG